MSRASVKKMRRRQLLYFDTERKVSITEAPQFFRRPASISELLDFENAAA